MRPHFLVIAALLCASSSCVVVHEHRAPAKTAPRKARAARKRAVPVKVTAVTVAPAPLVPAPADGLEDWSTSHAAAARDFCVWGRLHPNASVRISEWDARHPEQTQELVAWALAHPFEGVEAFAAARRGWRLLGSIIERHRSAAHAFMVWCRKHPSAAEALIRYPRGLRRAIRHLSC